MKKMILTAVFAIVAAIALAACTTVPTQDQVVQIQIACAADAGVRPSVTALEIFATPAEVATINAARAIIDPICANPTAAPEANAVTAFSAAVGQIVALKTQLAARQTTQKP